MGIAFEVHQIINLPLRQYIPDRNAADLQLMQMILEPLPDGILTKMAEGRIANIVDKACAQQHIRKVFLCMGFKPGVHPPLSQLAKHIFAKLFSDGRHFQRMCQTGPNIIVFIQREYLCLILEPAEQGAAYDRVIIALRAAMIHIVLRNIVHI